MKQRVRTWFFMFKLNRIVAKRNVYFCVRVHETVKYDKFRYDTIEVGNMLFGQE